MPRIVCKYVESRALTSDVLEVVCLTDQPVQFVPGQFASLELAPKLRRSYSIVSVEPASQGSRLSFWVKMLPGGLTENFFKDSANLGSSLNMVGPAGRFGLADSKKIPVFIATGTGIAPFIPMLKMLQSSDALAAAYLFFGVGRVGEDFATAYIHHIQSDYPGLKYIRCFSKETPETVDSSVIQSGRVTEVVPRVLTDLWLYDFYICGNPLMVQDMVAVLESLEVSKDSIFFEKYGN